MASQYFESAGAVQHACFRVVYTKRLVSEVHETCQRTPTGCAPTRAVGLISVWRAEEQDSSRKPSSVRGFGALSVKNTQQRRSMQAGSLRTPGSLERQ
jgi:hypothetical protein